MKRITISLFATFLLFALIYLIGCFCENSFNIGNWNIAVRNIIGGFGGVMSIIIGAAIFTNSNFKQP